MLDMTKIPEGFSAQAYVHAWIDFVILKKPDSMEALLRKYQHIEEVHDRRFRSYRGAP